MRFFTAVLATSFALTPQTDGLGRAQLLPFGKFAARDGRPGNGKTWEVSNAQGVKIAAALNAIAAQTPIVIDYEHQTLTAQEKGHKALAAGWMKSFEWLNGKGLFSAVDWTKTAQAHIAADEYKYISPVITYDDQGTVTGVALAALVNFPGLLGMEAAMTAALCGLNGFNDAAPPFSDHPNPETHMERAQLLALLGLPAAATDADITSAITSMTALKAKPAVPGALVAALGLPATADERAALSAVASLKATGGETVALVTTMQGQIAALTTQLNDGALKTLLDDAEKAGKIVPANRETYLKIGRGDMALLSSLLSNLQPIPGLAGQTTGQQTALDASGNKVAVLTGVQKSLAKQLGLSEEAYAKTLKAESAA